MSISRYPQHAELDLAAFRGSVPVELFGRTEFPAVGDGRWVITVAGYGFYWFALESRAPAQESIEPARDLSAAPVITIRSWSDLQLPGTISNLLRYLPRFIQTRRWYRGKGRRIRTTTVQDIVPVTDTTYTIVARIEYTDGDPAFYLLPLAVGIGEAGIAAAARHLDTAFVRVRTTGGEEGVLYGGLWNPEFSRGLLRAIAGNKTVDAPRGQLQAWRTKWFDGPASARSLQLDVAPSRAEQSNSSVMLGEQFILKIFRKVESGVNPDAEVSGFLLDHGFHNTAKLLGGVEYRAKDEEPMTVAILQEFVPNQGDAWKYTVDALVRYYENAQARTDWERLISGAKGHVLDLASAPLSAEAHELMQTYVEPANLLGRRTAEMHLALTDFDAGPDFRPEPFADDYRQGLYYGLYASVNRVMELLSERAPGMAPETAELAYRVLARADELRRRVRRLRETRINTVRIRIHGAFHLAQVLYTGKDFYIIDFEGDPWRPMSERRLKRSALRDVAGMLRSFEYAAYTMLYDGIGGFTARPEVLPLLESAALFWSKWASASFLNGYMTAADNAPFLPPKGEQVRVLLESYLIERALYELTFELENRPEVAAIPMRGIVNLCSE